MVQDYIDVAIEQHQLPSGFRETVSQWYLPLANEVAKLSQQAQSALVLGVQGTQGSGKSTLADFLTILLEHQHQLPAVSLSIDDFYLTREQRKQLSQQIHPLFATRGVPGTHDTQLAINTIKSLKTMAAGESHAIPRFNKATDDRAPYTEWPIQKEPVRIIILEGWCVGIKPQTEEALSKPVNLLEETEDAEGLWRRYVNDQLSLEYQRLFDELDALAVLKAPSFDCVYDWRLLQEQKLSASLVNASEAERSKLLTPEQVKRFISHYQRLTEHGLVTLPAQADWVFELNNDHQITHMKSRHEHD